MNYEAVNQQAWDSMSRSNSIFAKAATDEECAQPLLSLDRRGWLPGSVSGWKVLCLAAGGGWQSILYALAGAEVTVVDLSPEMLRRDEMEAERRRVRVRTVHASMTDLGQLAEAEFDLVHQPVSTCYIPRLDDVYAQVARVLRPGGLYISQHKQPTSLQVVDRDSQQRYIIGVPYYWPDPLPATLDTAYRETGAVEYLHRWDELIGSLCRSGFVIEDLAEPRRGDPKAPPGHFKHRGQFIPPYVRMKARRVAGPPVEGRSPIWVPGSS